MATHEGFDLIEKYFPTLDAGQLEAGVWANCIPSGTNASM